MLSKQFYIPCNIANNIKIEPVIRDKYIISSNNGDKYNCNTLTSLTDYAMIEILNTPLYLSLHNPKDNYYTIYLDIDKPYIFYCDTIYGKSLDCYMIFNTSTLTFNLLRI